MEQAPNPYEPPEETSLEEKSRDRSILIALSASAALSLTGVALFYYVATHLVLDDRTNRIPIVEWKPAGIELAWWAAVLCVAGWFAAVFLVDRKAHIARYAAVFLAVLPLFLWLGYLGLMYED